MALAPGPVRPEGSRFSKRSPQPRSRHRRRAKVEIGDRQCPEWGVGLLRANEVSRSAPGVLPAHGLAHITLMKVLAEPRSTALCLSLFCLFSSLPSSSFASFPWLGSTLPPLGTTAERDDWSDRRSHRDCNETLQHRVGAPDFRGVWCVRSDFVAVRSGASHDGRRGGSLWVSSAAPAPHSVK